MHSPLAPRESAAHAEFSSAAPEQSGAAQDVLRHALLESRQRWRDIATLSGDIVFETDERGHFVFVSPNPAIGWPTALLLGQPAHNILAEPADAEIFNPFRPTCAVRRRRAWLRRPDGESVCVSFAATPLLDDRGRVVGARGIGQDITEQDGVDAGVAAALRRVEVIDHILWRMRQEVLAPRMMQAALDAIARALGAEGCAVIDLLGASGAGNILHRGGAGANEMLPIATGLLETTTDDTQTTSDPTGRPLLVCPSNTRFGENAGLAVWRPVGGRAFDAEERTLVASATTIVRVILEHENIQREMSRQARTDTLTGLANRRAFLDEMARRIDRLEHDKQPGTLMFVDLDNFRILNERRGHDIGDDALCVVAALLRATFRPGDLIARFGADDFALWLEGADEFVAAERAEALRIEGPGSLAHLTGPAEIAIGFSIGIATRWPGFGEEFDGVLQRADHALSEVKRLKPGSWLVSKANKPI